MVRKILSLFAAIPNMDGGEGYFPRRYQTRESLPTGTL